MADECWSISFLRSSSFLQFIRVQLMETWHVQEAHNRSDHGQVEKTGVGWKIDMLHVFHPRPADWTRLEEKSRQYCQDPREGLCLQCSPRVPSTLRFPNKLWSP